MMLRVRRRLDDLAGIGPWLALTLAGAIAAFVATSAMWGHVIGWAASGAGGLALVVVKARRGR